MSEDGRRIVVTEKPPSKTSPHVSGGSAEGVGVCPNCAQPLFPVFRLFLAALDVPELRGLWSQESFVLLMCPACALYMEPYWQTPTTAGWELVGGERDGERLLEIEAPYESREVRLEKLVPGDRRPEHQLGGLPPYGEAALECVKCREPMNFAGVIAYDDENVPLYEPPHRPVALIIGDHTRLYWYTCKDCSVIGYRWIR